MLTFEINVHDFEIILNTQCILILLAPSDVKLFMPSG